MTNDILRAGPLAIVVGAAGELGHATAVKLADRGMTVVAVDRNGPGLEIFPPASPANWSMPPIQALRLQWSNGSSATSARRRRWSTP